MAIATPPKRLSMVRSLPLSSLKAFDAVGRHLSFTRAAKELCVTHGAISHQIRGLEARLGVRLFERGPRGVGLTEHGRLVAHALRQAFSQIDDALALLQTESASTVALGAPLSLAMRWLVPRLADFHEKHPDIVVDLRPCAESSLPDDIDVALSFGAGSWPGFTAERIRGEVLVPVMNPKKRGSVRHAEIESHLLLQDEAPGYEGAAWRAWLDAAGLSDARVRFGSIYRDPGLLLEAAARGHGIALARGLLVADDLATGRLSRVSDVELPCTSSYYLLSRTGRRESSKVQAIRAWLMTQMQISDTVDDLTEVAGFATGQRFGDLADVRGDSVREVLADD